MQQNILLSPISLDELETRIVSRFKTELLAIAPQTTKQPEEDFITAKQVSKLLGISLVTIHKWKKDGKLKCYRFGSRVRFKQSEIVGCEKFNANHK